ncbi:Hypothetical predicted protein [Mytilus galloprovincialis]|uniref:Uncharacterized protein n=1 Tax=Mytilus galloprovincialis TaxID=29158 RepID=A0A8B6BFW4_MYTGA|nr:Hypothetical predicted protein [Mytilus galloprovincialis]
MDSNFTDTQETYEYTEDHMDEACCINNKGRHPKYEGAYLFELNCYCSLQRPVLQFVHVGPHCRQHRESRYKRGRKVIHLLMICYCGNVNRSYNRLGN